MNYNIFANYIITKCDNAILFCMPAHNGTDIGINNSIDITELSFSDNLQNPSTIIRDIEDRIALSYNVPYSFIFTSGATSAILSALVVAKSKGNTIAIGNNMHKSIYSLSSILGLKIICTPTFSIQDIVGNLADTDTLCGVIFTSPDYFGKTYDIMPARRLSDNFDALLICDQSHGGHFAFSSLLPMPNDEIADIAISSWHKTLPVLTGGAVATCRNIEIYLKLLTARADTHTTSPSYMTMASLDGANNRMRAEGEKLYNDIYTELLKFKQLLPNPFSIITTDDFTRVVISAGNIQGNFVVSELEKQGIYIEMFYENLLVLIVTPFNYQHLPALALALNNIAIANTINCPSSININSNNINEFATNQDVVTHLSDLTATACEKSSLQSPADNTCPKDKIDYDTSVAISLDVTSALGYISAKSVGIYPPGVPILTLGKLITERDIELLTCNISQIFGLESGKIICYRRKP